jgi:hypothetical protein
MAKWWNYAKLAWAIAQVFGKIKEKDKVNVAIDIIDTAVNQAKEEVKEVK